MTVTRWAGDEPYEQVHVLYLLTREDGRLGIKAMVPLAVAAPPRVEIVSGGGGWCGARHDRGPPRLGRHVDVVGTADLVGVQPDAVLVEVHGVGRRIDDDDALVLGRALEDVADGDHRARHRRPDGTALATPLGDHAAVAVDLVGGVDASPVGLGHRVEVRLLLGIAGAAVLGHEPTLRPYARSKTARLTRSATSCCPSSDRAAAACRACRSGRRGSSSTKSTVRGHLKWARLLAAERQQLLLERRPGLDAVHQLDDRLDLLAEVLVGHADDRRVEDLGVRDQQVLGLLRVDVHAARDDHVRLAVGQVEVAVGVDVADVADRRRGAAGAAALGRLVGIAPVREVRGPVEPDRARLPLRHLVAVVVEDQQRAGDAVADRARVGEPLLAVAPREAVGLGGAVVLDDLRAEPLDHVLLDLHRARRGGVDDRLERRQVVARADVVGQLEHPAEHRRHDLAVGDAVALDERRGTARGRSAP